MLYAEEYKEVMRKAVAEGLKLLGHATPYESVALCLTPKMAGYSALNVADSPRSSSCRAIWILVAAGGADGDLKTHDRWAAFLSTHGGKVTSRDVTDLCAVCGLEPIRVRDLMRVLRALWHAGGRVRYVGAHLDVEDEETVRRLLHRAGLEHPAYVSLDQFLSVQQFVPCDHPLVSAVRGLFRDRGTTSAPGSAA
jgi:hypothetical protein